MKRGVYEILKVEKKKKKSNNFRKKDKTPIGAFIRKYFYI